MSFRSMSGRGWAYVGAGLGGAVSIAANVAHSYVPPEDATAAWSPPAGAVVGAVFWPVSLFVAIEILARVAWPDSRRWTLLRFGGLVPVAAVAAFVSYRHLSGLLTFYGEDQLTAVLGPLAVDGLMVMATGALLATAPKRELIAEPVFEPVLEDDPVDDEPVRDPWQFAQPVAVEPVPPPPAEPVEPVAEPQPELVEPVAEPQPEPVRDPVRRRVTPQTLTSAQRVMAAHAKEPGATHERIATLAGVSLSTVKRHRPSGSPSEPSPAPIRINGHKPELQEVKL